MGIGHPADIRKVEDLANLMNVYRMWAHKMFPKGEFAQTIQRVEVMCRGRRMNVSDTISTS
jgi:replication fork protection complex subunit Csm3/Swi3